MCDEALPRHLLRAVVDKGCTNAPPAPVSSPVPSAVA